jgi:hypothetical protein
MILRASAVAVCCSHASSSSRRSRATSVSWRSTEELLWRTAFRVFTLRLRALASLLLALERRRIAHPRLRTTPIFKEVLQQGFAIGEMGSRSTSHGSSQKVQPMQLHQRSAARRARTSRTRAGLSAKSGAGSIDSSRPLRAARLRRRRLRRYLRLPRFTVAAPRAIVTGPLLLRL